MAVINGSFEVEQEQQDACLSITHGAGGVAAAVEGGEGGCPLSRRHRRPSDQEEEGAQGHQHLRHVS